MSRALVHRLVLLPALAGFNPMSEAAGQAARIERVVHGLRPRVEIVGRPAVRWSLGERMAHYKIPGVSIAVIEGGRIAWARGFGLKEAGTTDSVTPETLFQAASISKPVTATAMLRLVEQGKLSLDENVNTDLKSWKLPDNQFTAKEKVTLRRIVSHSAGLTVHGFPGYKSTDPLPSVVQVLAGEKPANTPPVLVDTVPGERWQYSGGGTTIMQLVLMDVTGEPFPTLMQRLVLRPVGMTRSTYQQPLPESRRGEAASAHNAAGEVIEGNWHVYPEMAAAGLWTTPTDLAKWALAIASARAGRSASILSQRLATEMLTPQKPPTGLGPFLQGRGQGFRFGHGGDNAGFKAEVWCLPEAGLGAAVMVNGDGGSGLNQEILYAIAAEYGWPDYGPKQVKPVPLDTMVLNRIAGRYTLDYEKKNFSLDVTRAASGLRGRVVFQPDGEELLAVSASAFVGAESGFEYEFTRDGQGTATGVTVRLFGLLTVQGTRDGKTVRR